MAKETFEIKGAKQFEKMLLDLGPQVARKAGNKALREAAKPIVARAKELVPVRTGELRKGIGVVAATKGRKEDQLRVLVTVKGKPAPVAHLVEFGTRHSAAKPFLRPAFDERVGEALQTLGDALGDAIVNEAKKMAQ